MKIISFWLVLILITTILALCLGFQNLPIKLMGDGLIKIIFESTPLNLEESIMLEIRLPRIFLSLLTGAALSVAGVTAQGIFRSSLADPGIIGVSAGAALAAVIGISFGLDEASFWAIPLLASLGGVFILVILFFIYNMHTHNHTIGIDTESKTSVILLTGFSLSSLCGALISLFISFFQSEKYHVSAKIFQWLLGSFEARGWDFILYSLPSFTLGVFLCFLISKDLDLLHLGSETATSLGSNQKWVYMISILSIGVLVGTVTVMVGMIAFVGLIVPHINRFLVGGLHNKLLISSMLSGAWFMLVVDTISRSVENIYLPPGVITSLLGAPFFLFLVNRYKVLI